MIIQTGFRDNTTTSNTSNSVYPEEFNFSNEEAYKILTDPNLDDSYKAFYRDQYANDYASRSVATANDFEATQAQINRDFQERMSNTQYQRAVADLQRAGLNPALAYSQGGAGNLSGSTASSSTASPTTSTNKSGSATLDLVSGFIEGLLDALFLGMLFKGKKK